MTMYRLYSVILPGTTNEICALFLGLVHGNDVGVVMVFAIVAVVETMKGCIVLLRRQESTHGHRFGYFHEGIHAR